MNNTMMNLTEISIETEKDCIQEIIHYQFYFHGLIILLVLSGLFFFYGIFWRWVAKGNLDLPRLGSRSIPVVYTIFSQNSDEQQDYKNKEDCPRKEAKKEKNIKEEVLEFPDD